MFAVPSGGMAFSCVRVSKARAPPDPGQIAGNRAASVSRSPAPNHLSYSICLLQHVVICPGERKPNQSTGLTGPALQAQPGATDMAYEIPPPKKRARILLSLQT